MRSLGVESELVYPGAPDVKPALAETFLLDRLKPANE